MTVRSGKVRLATNPGAALSSAPEFKKVNRRKAGRWGQLAEARSRRVARGPSALGLRLLVAIRLLMVSLLTMGVGSCGVSSEKAGAEANIPMPSATCAD